MVEALQTKLDAHIQESDRHYLEMTTKLKEISDNLNTKVSYKEFTWILGILIIILMSMFGWIAWQISDLQRTSENTNKNVSMIQGKLEPYDVQFKN
jgi:predicted negative regulator of RcsB-dependent stress response